MKLTKYAIIFITLIIIPFLTINCGSLGKRYEKKEVSEYRINTSGKNKITLTNVTGNIKVSKGDSSSILIVKAEKTGKVRKKDLDKPLESPRVVLDTSSDVINISGELSKSKVQFFNFGTSGNSIDFDVRLPENIKLSVDNTNGKIDLNNIVNELDISLVNGSLIFYNLSGNVSLDVTNGSINGTVDSSKGMKINVVNGGVNLTIDTLYKGIVQAEVVNGKIIHENMKFIQLTDDKKSFKGVLGSGSNEIRIEVVNGKVKLLGK